MIAAILWGGPQDGRTLDVPTAAPVPRLVLPHCDACARLPRRAIRHAYALHTDGIYRYAGEVR